MRLPKPIPCLLALCLPLVCGSAPAPRGLTTGSAQGCTFEVSAQPRAGFPPTSDIVVTRVASSTCPLGGGRVVVGNTYTNGPAFALSLAAQDLGVAASYTSKSSPGGSAGLSLVVVHVDPASLAVVRRVSLTALASPTAGRVYSGELTLSDPTTLRVSGTKDGTLPYETGSGSSYVATYPDFFTSTTAPSISAY